MSVGPTQNILHYPSSGSSESEETTPPIDDAIESVRSPTESCTQAFLLQNFNIVCTLSDEIANFEHPLDVNVVRRIISNVCQWPCGRQLFKEMVSILKDKKVVLACCDKTDPSLNLTLQNLNDLKFTQTECNYFDNRFLLLLYLPKTAPTTFSRHFASMDLSSATISFKILEITTSEQYPVEGLIAAHEFYHVCSFCRKIDTSFTAKEKHNQESQLLFPIPSKLKPFFISGEEGRNLLSYILVNGRIEESIGEFTFWQTFLYRNSLSRNTRVLPLYCDSLPTALKTFKPLLQQLFLIKFPECPLLPDTDAVAILDNKFLNFSLIDVPRDGNCGPVALLVASGEMDPRLLRSISTTDCPILSTEQYYSSISDLRQNLAKSILSLQHTHKTEIANRLGTLGSMIAPNDLAFVARAMQRAIVLVQPSTKIMTPYEMVKFTPEGNEEQVTFLSPEQILKNDPRVLFIYFNGVNHFQALKQKASSHCSIQ